MDALTLSRLGVKHTQSAVAESLRINTGYDMTSPATFYGIVNEHCNVKCRQCEYWRLKEYKDEILTYRRMAKCPLERQRICGRIFHQL
ncbi:hypothetical protein Q5692_10920 [Microcoleus sp. C2C3]|uniref:hypothetical protein n=1 Tax=unclassified Microcoleus TaxID=2642155 RepID=UPI002FD3805B